MKQKIPLIFILAITAASAVVGYEAGRYNCTLPTAPVGTLSWATSTNTH